MNRTLALFAALAILLSLSESCFLVTPGFAQPIELAYDDGDAECSWAKMEVGMGGYYAVRFSPPLNASHIVAAKYYIEKKPGTFNVLILDSDRNPVHEKPVVPKKTGWFTVDLSKENIFVKGEFYAAMKWTVAEAPWLGGDETKPDGRSFSVDTDGRWVPYPEIKDVETRQPRGRDGDFMIRVRVEAAKDTDRDGLYDFEEAILGTDPKNPDTDDDGLNDADEINIHRTDPKLKDTDGDGLSDSEEVQEYGTDPLAKDTDRDGVDDGDEIAKGTDPKVSDRPGEILRNALPIVAIIALMALIAWRLLRRRKAPLPPTPLTLGKKYCMHCGAQIDEIAQFCPKCGGKQDVKLAQDHMDVILARSRVSAPKKYCIHCGASMPADAVYCPQCDKKQTEEVTAPRPQAPGGRVEIDGRVKSELKCPSCAGDLEETTGSPISPYINVYTCTKCGWRKLRCGDRNCDGYMEPEKIGYRDTVRYNCTKCNWTGTGRRFDFQKAEKVHISEFADKLPCAHCGKINRVKEWPVDGDYVPFYCQKESGNHTVKTTCPHCGKDWYVVWDDNPGPIKPLMF